MFQKCIVQIMKCFRNVMFKIWNVSETWCFKKWNVSEMWRFWDIIWTFYTFLLCPVTLFYDFFVTFHEFYDSQPTCMTFRTFITFMIWVIFFSWLLCPPTNTKYSMYDFSMTFMTVHQCMTFISTNQYLWLFHDFLRLSLLSTNINNFWTFITLITTD